MDVEGVLSKGEDEDKSLLSKGEAPKASMPKGEAVEVEGGGRLGATDVEEVGRGGIGGGGARPAVSLVSFLGGGGGAARR